MTVKSDQLREIAKRQRVHVPGAGEPPPPTDRQPVPEAERAEAPVTPETGAYWADKPSSEAKAYWEGKPEAERGPFNVLCSDGWYCAPWVDPRIRQGVRGV